MHASFRRGDTIGKTELAAEGIVYQHVPVGTHEPHLAALMETEGYPLRDELCLAPDTPNLATTLARFAEEHRHDDDEVRYVVDGEGIFEIRSNGDRWIRLIVGPGDLIVLPGGRWHRFSLGETRTIHCVRLFRSGESWTPSFRNEATTLLPE